jgi:hypothetical protein
MDNGLPCLDLLAATPEILRGLMIGLSEEDALWKPAPDRFSIAEVLAHLTLSEGHCYRERIDRMTATMPPSTRPSTATATLKKTSPTSRSSARPTSNTCATCPPAQAAVPRCTRRRAK